MSAFNNFNEAVSLRDRLHWGRVLAAETRNEGMDASYLEEYLAELNIASESRDAEDEFEEIGDYVSIRGYGGVYAKCRFSTTKAHACPPEFLRSMLPTAEEYAHEVMVYGIGSQVIQCERKRIERLNKALKMTRKRWKTRDLARGERRKAKYN
jgi:hypothetical protein